jgi:spermidine/putrescine transport system permease protein
MAAALPAKPDLKGPQRRPGWRAWLMLAPMVVWLLAFVVVPTAILAVYSFCEPGEGEMVKYSFTIEHYQRIFDPHEGYLKIFGRSLGYAGLTTILCVLIGYPVAYYIGRASETRRNRLLILIMVPFWTSFLIRTYAWMSILADEGMLNGLLMYVRFISEPWSLLYTPFAVIIGLVYSYLPFMILPIYGSVEKLDSSLIEAAFDLGAGPVRAFQRVVIPLTRPGIIAGALARVRPSIAMFAITELMGGGQVPMLGNVIQNQFLAARNPPFGSALGITLLLLFVAALWIAGRRQPAGNVMG